MIHTITIETQNQDDLTLFRVLAERLGLRLHETHDEDTTSESDTLRQLNSVNWHSDETGDELNTMLRNARSFGGRDVQL
jgi:asparagine synthetase B (glutamine-hydrolysing)